MSNLNFKKTDNAMMKTIEAPTTVFLASPENALIAITEKISK